MSGYQSLANKAEPYFLRKPGLRGFLVHSIAENWCRGAVLRGMSILGAELST